MIKNLNKKNKKKGFTLIELIIVIAIIAILAAVALPKFGEVRLNANVKTDIANAKTIANAATTLFTEEKLEAGTYTVGDTAATELNNYLQSEPQGKAGDQKGEDFKVVISDQGGVTVYLTDGTNDTQVYPNGEEPYELD